MPKSASGKKVIKILTRNFGFVIHSQKGSHVKLRKLLSGDKITTIVPTHTELAYGTLRGIVELAKIDFEKFKKFL